MSETFDPYYKWLGIAPSEQPANHYRLLGLNLFEADLDVIENASDRQMSHLRSFQTGPRMRECQQLLNEVAAARVLLLDAQRKSVYDQLLQSTFIPVEAPPPTTTAPPAPATSAVPVVVAKRSRHRRKHAIGQNAMILGGLIGLVVLFALGFGIRKALQKAPPPPSQTPPPESKRPTSPIEAVAAPNISSVDTQRTDSPYPAPISSAVTASNTRLRTDAPDEQATTSAPSATMATPPPDAAASTQQNETPTPSGSLGDLVNASAPAQHPVPAAVAAPGWVSAVG